MSTVCLWMVRVELVGTVTQLSVVVVDFRKGGEGVCWVGGGM